MIQTSDKYKENIKADTELIQCRAELSFVPPGATEGAVVSATPAQSVSRIDQLKNGSFGMDANWGTLEKGRIVLDGSVTFIPPDNTRQIGFFSEGMCDENGVFAVPEQVEYLFNTVYDIVGVSIAFDDLGGEWASELDLTAYDESGNELQTMTFANHKALFYAEIRQHGVKKLVVSVKKWNVGERYCKISQIVPGIILSFASEGIFEFEFEESIDPFSSTVRFPEVTLVFDNTDNEFNIINPNGLISFLRQKMKTVPKLDLIAGARTESIGMGQFYLYSFPKTDQADEAKVSCRPSIAFELGNYETTGRTLQTVEEAVAILFENVEEPVVIDEELKNIHVNQYIGEDIPIHTAMAYLAIACCGYWKFERDGSYRLKKWALPEEMTNDIDYDNMWSKPATSMGEKYTSCTTKYYVWDETNQSLKGTDVTVAAEDDDGTALNITSYFICSEEQAREVAKAYMDYKNLRLSHTAQYRGDMSIEAADGITIQNDFAHSEVIVMTHSLTFDTEGLTGSIVGRGLD
ncbi:MAG: hypothetical protein MR278_09465 [Bacteroidales bacterium]|nr:hypothetical protein [Anaerotignum sp.]MCI5680181.1 hypothetical protein [Bacteroidales bacterium]MDY3926872.1 hypothetical protein [Anaerotignum sp.]